VEKYGRSREIADEDIKRRMRFACWIPKATVTLPEHVIFIACPLQQWLQEHASILHYRLC